MTSYINAASTAKVYTNKPINSLSHSRNRLNRRTTKIISSKQLQESLIQSSQDQDQSLVFLDFQHQDFTSDQEENIQSPRSICSRDILVRNSKSWGSKKLKHLKSLQKSLDKSEVIYVQQDKIASPQHKIKLEPLQHQINVPSVETIGQNHPLFSDSLNDKLRVPKKKLKKLVEKGKKMAAYDVRPVNFLSSTHIFKREDQYKNISSRYMQRDSLTQKPLEIKTLITLQQPVHQVKKRIDPSPTRTQKLQAVNQVSAQLCQIDEHIQLEQKKISLASLAPFKQNSEKLSQFNAAACHRNKSVSDINPIERISQSFIDPKSMSQSNLVEVKNNSCKNVSYVTNSIDSESIGYQKLTLLKSDKHKYKVSNLLFPAGNFATKSVQNLNHSTLKQKLTYEKKPIRLGSEKNSVKIKPNIDLVSSNLSQKFQKNDQNYKVGLQRLFKVENDLNKYTVYNYNQFQRKFDLLTKRLDFIEPSVQTESKIIKQIQQVTPKTKNVTKIVHKQKTNFLNKQTKAPITLQEVIPSQIEELSEKSLQDEVEDRNELKQLDWKNSQIFKYFCSAQQSGTDMMTYIQSQHKSIYTCAELDYNIQLLQLQIEVAVANDSQDQVMCSKKNPKVTNIEFDKIMHTLKVLMKLLAIGFHFEKIYQRHKDSKTVEYTIMLMSRCRKLFSAAEYLQTIFKLIDRTENEKSVNTRLLCAIKGFLTEHTLFPMAFNFKGQELLENLCRH